MRIGKQMKITLSADHRITDGAEVANFLMAVKGYLENPMQLAISPTPLQVPHAAPIRRCRRRKADERSQEVTGAAFPSCVGDDLPMLRFGSRVANL